MFSYKIFIEYVNLKRIYVLFSLGNLMPYHQTDTIHGVLSFLKTMVAK